MSKSFPPLDVHLAFDEREVRCRLTIQQVARLQQARKAGIGTIFLRVCVSGDYYWEDLTEVVYQGVIGGGEFADPREAVAFVNTYSKHWPIEQWRQMAMAILLVAMHGYEPDKGPVEDGEDGNRGNAEAATMSGST